MSFLRLVIVLILGCGWQIGCEHQFGSDFPSLASVSGIVTFEHQPLPAAIVTFIPRESGRPSTAVTDENGFYVLAYDNTHNGAVVGTHQVSVSTAVAAEYDEQRQLIPGTGIKERVPARYHSPTTLELEVTSGENELDITLQK